LRPGLRLPAEAGYRTEAATLRSYRLVREPGPGVIARRGYALIVSSTTSLEEIASSAAS
jgi:hypothetical protein